MICQYRVTNMQLKLFFYFSVNKYKTDIQAGVQVNQIGFNKSWSIQGFSKSDLDTKLSKDRILKEQGLTTTWKMYYTRP